VVEIELTTEILLVTDRVKVKSKASVVSIVVESKSISYVLASKVKVKSKILL
jgi:hypothetical protein